MRGESDCDSFHCQSSAAAILGNMCKELNNFQLPQMIYDNRHVGDFKTSRWTLYLKMSRVWLRRDILCRLWDVMPSIDNCQVPSHLNTTHCVYRAMFYSGDVRPLVWHSLNINNSQLRPQTSSNIHEVKKTSQTIFSSWENKHDLCKPQILRSFLPLHSAFQD